MSVRDLIRALQVIDDSLPVAERTQQGWRAAIVVSTDQRQVAEVHAREASVVSVSFDQQGGPNLEDAGYIIAETRIGEAVRKRTFVSRRQGFAFNVPAGVTRLFCRGFKKPYVAFVQMAPGITTTEHVSQAFDLAPFASVAVEAPEFARTVRVIAQRNHITANVSYGGGAVSDLQTPVGAPASPMEATLAAYGSITVTESGGIGATAILIWEVTA